MKHYDFDTVKKNIFHELNKMLVAVSKDDESQKDLSSHHKMITDNEMVKYYLKFPLKTRENMSVKLGVSEKTLHRFYEDPLRILDNHEAILQLSIFLSYSYPHTIDLFFNNSSRVNFKNKNDSIIMKEILKYEEERSIEERRDIARVVHLILTLNIPTHDFSEINFKMIHKKLYTKENIKRLNNFIDNI